MAIEFSCEVPYSLALLGVRHLARRGYGPARRPIFGWSLPFVIWVLFVPKAG